MILAKCAMRIAVREPSRARELSIEFAADCRSGGYYWKRRVQRR